MKILCLDGGGIFGIVQATILSKTTNLGKFDVIAGTSIGSVVGAMIASGDSNIQGDLVSFFNTWMPQVFSGHTWRKYLPLTPKYNDSKLNKALQNLFPVQKFKDLKVPMFITAADLNGRKLKVFYSRDSIDGEMPLWEVLRSAVAAETYFLPWNGIGDGGVFANNPSMVAITGAVNSLKVNISDIEICSIGTGIPKWVKPVGTTNNWSLLAWGSYLINASLSGAASSMHEFFATRIGLKTYYRVQFIRKNGWDMDNPDNMDKALVAWKPQIESAILGVESF